MGLRGVHHIAVTTRDPSRLAEFYRNVLGLQESKRNQDDGGLYSVWLDAGGVTLMIERTEHSARADGSAGLHLLALAIGPGDRERWIAHLAKHEVPVERSTDFTIYFRDPDGNRLGLSSYPERD